MPRTLLVVDDVATNRRILGKILSEDYELLEAENGLEAMSILKRNYKRISAVLLDLSMPVMDGYEVLRLMHQNAALSLLPVIVMTGDKQEQSEVQALQMGAMDYISKPYSVPIVKQRIHNMINLRETAATVNALQRDKLTGLYNREAFFEKVAPIIKTHLPGYYVMSCFDIDNFKVINDQYGTEKGDAVLRHVGLTMRGIFESTGAIGCRMTADNFAILAPKEALSSEILDGAWDRAAQFDGTIPRMTFSIGRYIIADLTLTASAMYDRASIAKASIKGRFDKHMAIYDESMRNEILHEQEIVNEMKNALEKEQFEVWLQPQFNHSTGALIGAEALVRWKHPTKGLMPPGKFIPVFERNGFIYELDKFIWAKSCALLRGWLDEGRNPLPVSVNISRYDILREDFFDYITGLVEDYNLNVELLRLEITESAFAKSTERIIYVVKRLINYGFTIEIDDFGSGYSSLNTLKDVPATVLKLDMRFLESAEDSQRGGNILESIVRMAKWLGMSVIAEGVETKKQADYLNSIGCSYIQGYLYSRPMSVDSYESLAKNIGKEEKMLALQTVENMDNNSFWDPDSMDTLIFNSYIGGACILEYHNDKLELLRANRKYMQVIGFENESTQEALKFNWLEHMDKPGREKVLSALKTAMETNDEVTDEFEFIDLPGRTGVTYLKSTLRIIAQSGDRFLAYCTNENMTAQRQAERKEREISQRMQAILDNLINAVTASVMIEGKLHFLFTNDRLFDMLGYRRDEFDKLEDTLNCIDPADRDRVIHLKNVSIETGESYVAEYRLVRKDKSVIWVRNQASITRFAGIDQNVMLSVLSDITDLVNERERQKELLDNLPCGAALYERDKNGDMSVVHQNRRYLEMMRINGNRAGYVYRSSVHPDDQEMLTREIAFSEKENRDTECDLRLLCGDGVYRSFHLVTRSVEGSDGKVRRYATYTPNREEEQTLKAMLPFVLKTIMGSAEDIIFAKDVSLKYISVSDGFVKHLNMTDEREIIGKDDWQLYDRKLAEEYIACDTKVLETGRAVENATVGLPSIDGVPHTAIVSNYPIKDASGSVVGIYGIARDITAQNEAFSRLRLLTDSIPGGLASYAIKSIDDIRLTYFSDGFCQLFGFSREEYQSLADNDSMGRVFEEDRPVIAAKIQALIERGDPIECVYRVHTRDGGFRWIKHRGMETGRSEDTVIVGAALFDITDEHEYNARIYVRDEEYRLAIAQSGELCYRYDAVAKTLDASPEAVEVFGGPERIFGVPDGIFEAESIVPESVQPLREMFEAIDSGKKNGAATVLRRTKNDAMRFFETRFSTVFDREGHPTSAIILMSDITERREREAVYKKWQQSFKDRDPGSYTLVRFNLTQNEPVRESEGALVALGRFDSFVSFDECMLRYCNAFVHPEDRPAYVETVDMDALLAGYYRSTRRKTIDYREMRADDTSRWLRLTIEMVEYPDTTDIEAYLLYEDIDDSKRAELLTIERAETDPLTGLLNRTVFTSRMRARMRVAKPGQNHVFLLLDVDGFKLVNDVFGHGAGDAALVDIAQALKSILRSTDLVGRLGGDEFVMFIGDIPTEESAESKSRQICSLVRKGFSVDVQISASIGIAFFPRDGADFETLYKKADAALYYVKNSGKDSFAIFREGMEERGAKTAEDLVQLPAVSRATKKRRMLIVDDEVIDRSLLINMFADDFIIEKARNGPSALMQIRHYTSALSVVLLDIMMPGMDGFEVLRTMQANPETRSIPVIIVSADKDKETALNAIKLGATDMVIKPIDPELIRLRVQSAITKSENERLRAQNSYLSLKNSEVERYKTALECTGAMLIEYDWISGSFVYDPNLSLRVAGKWDKRGLWHILMSDMVAQVKTVKHMQELVHAVADDRSRIDGTMMVELKTVKGDKREFRFDVHKMLNDFMLTDKLLLLLTDISGES